MLTQHEVPLYLLKRKLLDPASIVTGKLAVTDISRRNCNFEIVNTQGPCYLVKQGPSPDKSETIAHEAEIYQRLQTADRAYRTQLSPYLPHFYGYDAQEQILILELVRDAEDLHQYQARQRRFSPILAAAMGKALGALHSQPRPENASANDSWFSGQPAWILAIHHPHLWIFWDASQAKLQLITLLQRSPEFCQLLDDLRQDWRADRLIHFDIKWNNWIIFAPTSSRRKTRLKLVDWELAGLGDPCWDVGSVFCSYLSSWLSSIPITGEDPPERFLELSRYPLERMHPALQSFWASYMRYMGLDTSTAEQWLLKAVRFAAARLVQTAFEQMQASSQLTGNVICVLQLGLNILKRPREAAALLLGLPLQQEE